MPLGPFRVEYVRFSPEIPQKKGYAKKARLLNGPKRFDIPVAGTSYRQADVIAAAKMLRAGGTKRVFEAELVYESDNRHDSNAVACYIVGNHVGYLPAALCKEFRMAMRPNIPSGMKDIPLFCQALFLGGHRRGDNIGIRLDLPKSSAAALAKELSKSQCLEKTP